MILRWRRPRQTSFQTVRFRGEAFLWSFFASVVRGAVPLIPVGPVLRQALEPQRPGWLHWPISTVRYQSAPSRCPRVGVGVFVFEFASVCCGCGKCVGYSGRAAFGAYGPLALATRQYGRLLSMSVCAAWVFLSFTPLNLPTQGTARMACRTSFI